MHILCPHCHNPIEVVKLVPREEIACPSCGSSFRLESDSTTDWKPGSDKIGKFELIEMVGQGAFGTVYKARDPELDRTVAVNQHNGVPYLVSDFVQADGGVQIVGMRVE